MSNPYQAPGEAATYFQFLLSENGQIQQAVLSEAIVRHLGGDTQKPILDAACGPGWLTKVLSMKFSGIEGCDYSEPFVTSAKKNYRGLRFTVADLSHPLPYAAGQFQSVILNMAASDIADISTALGNLFSITAPAGQLIVTIPNPYYSFPVGVWKRSIADALLGGKPKLVMAQPYAETVKIEREFAKNKTIGSHFYPLAYYINTARSAGFTLASMEELKSDSDSETFNLRYQLYRYPLLLLLEFIKPGA